MDLHMYQLSLYTEGSGRFCGILAVASLLCYSMANMFLRNLRYFVLRG